MYNMYTVQTATVSISAVPQCHHTLKTLLFRRTAFYGAPMTAVHSRRHEISQLNRNEHRICLNYVSRLHWNGLQLFAWNTLATFLQQIFVSRTTKSPTP